MSGDPLNLPKAAFAEAVGSSFRARVGPDAIELELASLRDGIESSVVEQFTLVFRGPLDAPLRQGTYALDNARIGEIPLFLVPVGRDERGYEYEAVFNRFVDQSV